eukprot:1177292-Prorocentrum_minimum.AAC.3
MRSRATGTSRSSPPQVIYGGVQKNIGPAGMAMVIVREDLLGNARCARQVRKSGSSAKNRGRGDRNAAGS